MNIVKQLAALKRLAEQWLAWWWRELTTAAIAAVGFFFLVFGYKSAFGVQLSGMSSMTDNFLWNLMTFYMVPLSTGVSHPTYQLVGMLIMSVGVGILVAAFLFYRHRR